MVLGTIVLYGTTGVTVCDMYLSFAGIGKPVTLWKPHALV